jgi:competence ComEA-like helix-hairpin-helix protein
MIRFTKEEKKAIIFLSICLFAGILAAYLKGEIVRSPGFAHPFFMYGEGENVAEKININLASEEELVKIKHVGPVLAERIVEYREKYGPFHISEDLKKVKGIGDKMYEKIIAQIKLE